MLTLTIEQYSTHVQQRNGWIEKARQLYKLTEARKALETQEKALKGVLVELSENRCAKGGGFLFTKIVRGGSVQYKKIPEVIEILKTINVDEYRGKEVESWKLERK